jgi:hypothetical protein
MRGFSLEDARSPIDREQLHRELDELLDLREATAPENCGDPGAVTFRSVCGKSSAADAAVAIANQLLLEAAGWAINDRIGRTILQARGADPGDDTHQNEYRGQAEFAVDGIWVQRDKSTAAVDRAVLRSLLSWTYSKALPLSLADALTDALRALEFGVVPPLVTPNRPRMRAAYALAPYRLGVLEYSHYLGGQGLRREAVHEELARSIWVIAPETLRSWERRDLPKVYSKEEIKTALDTAKAAGKIARILRRDPAFGDPTKGRTETIDGPAFWVHERWCSSERVSAFAAAFRNVLSQEDTTGGKVVDFASSRGAPA